MYLTDPTATTAAVAAAVAIALAAGHWIGDHPVQFPSDAAAKGRPSNELLAAGTPWHAGFASIARHIGTYLACQAVALALIALVAPLTLAGAVAALAISGSTHAVIDRRWPVQAIIRLKGGCADWPQAAYLIDQSLHHGALLVAAIAAALVTTAAAAAGTVAAGAAVLVAGLVVERHRAAVLTARPATTAQPVRAGDRS